MSFVLQNAESYLQRFRFRIGVAKEAGFLHVTEGMLLRWFLCHTVRNPFTEYILYKHREHEIPKIRVYLKQLKFVIYLKYK